MARRRYPERVRKKILKESLSSGVQKAAQRFGCAPSSIYRWRREKLQKRKEDKRMGRQEVFDSIMTKLDDISGSKGCMIVTRDGEIIASKLDKGFAQEKVAALSADAVGVVNKVIAECNFGKPDTMVIEGTGGKFATVAAEKGGTFIIILGDKSMNVGMAKMSLREAIDSFDEEMA